jgi:hypothetical protein
MSETFTDYEVIYRDPATGEVQVRYRRPLSDLSLAKQVEALTTKADFMGYDSPYRIRIGDNEFKSIEVQ